MQTTVPVCTGAAACPEKMAKIFSAAGIAVREGYGLTEASPGIAVNHFNATQALLGTVGPIINDVEVMISDNDQYKAGEGEILASGENIIEGYYKKPDETQQMIRYIDGKRWLCTGDIGKLVDGPSGLKYLKITDRKKELLRTSNGKYVAPAPIENKFKESFLIEQIMVTGEGKNFVAALILPSQEALKDWCEHKEIEWTNYADMLKTPHIIDKFRRVVHELNPYFSKIEQIKKFTLLPDTWESVKADKSIGELTPTLKLKRRIIRKKYEAEIEAMYG